MDEFHAEEAPTFPLLSLEQISNLPLGSRCAMFLEYLKRDLAAAVSVIRDRGAPISDRLFAERLAWAIAFNLDGSSDAKAAGNAPRRTMVGYVDRWPTPQQRTGSGGAHRLSPNRK